MDIEDLIDSLNDWNEHVLLAASWATLRELDIERAWKMTDAATLAQALRLGLRWWEFAMPRGVSAAELDEELSSTVDQYGMRTLPGPRWVLPTSAVVVIDGHDSCAALVHEVDLSRGGCTVRVTIFQDKLDTPAFEVPALEPTMPVQRFLEVFDDALAASPAASELLGGVGAQRMFVTTMVKTLHRAGWVMADFPVPIDGYEQPTPPS